MEIRPLGNRVWVKRDDPEDLSSIIIVPSSNDKSVTGTVLSVGIECECLKEGDKVMFPETAGVTIKVDEEEVFLLKEDDIFATL